MPAFSETLFYAKIPLTPDIPLYVWLVKGARYSVWIDSGVASMFPQFQQVMAEAGVAPRDLRLIVHTHSHHDHIGANAQLQDYTGCQIAAHPYYAAWHADFEQHLLEFARPFPELTPDTPELRAEVLDPLDSPRLIDIALADGVAFDLGGAHLESVWLPGHMRAEYGWLETVSGTLILGDAITGLDWPLFHSHLDVAGYRASLDTIEQLISAGRVQQVVAAHFDPMTPAQTLALIGQARAYIDRIETDLIRMLAASDTISLERLWRELCDQWGKRTEFRALNMVDAHMQDLVARGIARVVYDHTYALR